MLSSSRKKAVNKSTRFEVNAKSVYISRDEGFVKKYDLSGPKGCFHLNQSPKKLKKTVSTSKNKIF